MHLDVLWAKWHRGNGMRNCVSGWQVLCWRVDQDWLASPNVSLVSGFHFTFPKLSKATVSSGPKTVFRNLLTTYCLWPAENFLFSLKINSFWVVVTLGYYWIFGYWFEFLLLLLFPHQTKLESFTRSPCDICVSFHQGSKLFTAITGFTMNFISDTDFCVSKKWNKTDHRWHYLNDSTYVCPFFHICCNPIMALSYYLKYCHL